MLRLSANSCYLLSAICAICICEKKKKQEVAARSSSSIKHQAGLPASSPCSFS
jgi:hypothetical protein